MYRIGQNINSFEHVRPVSVRPATTDKVVSSVFGSIFTKFGTQLPLNITKKIFWEVSEIGTVGVLTKL